MMHGFGYGGFGGFGIFEILTLVITLGLIIGMVLLVVWAVRRLSEAGSRQTFTHRGESQLTAREILQMRYARGEITRDQYKEMLADLN